MLGECQKYTLLLVGPFPPPVGGVSVHVERVYRRLRAKRQAVAVLDLFSRRTERQDGAVFRLSNLGIGGFLEMLAVRRLLAKNALVHVHVASWRRFAWVAIPLCLFFFGFHRVITIHGGSFADRNARGLRRFVAQLCLSLFKTVIVVNESQYKWCIRAGICPTRIDKIPAFISGEKCGDLSKEKVLYEGQSVNQVCVATSGFLTEVFNYDILIDCIDMHGHEEFFFVFCFYGKRDEAYEKSIINRLASYKNVKVFRDLDSKAFERVLIQSDIYVRCSRTDGDSVAVREAVAFGKRVIASDVVERPKGCEVFDVECSEELSGLISKARSINSAENVDSCDYFQELLNVYRKNGWNEHLPEDEVKEKFESAKG